MEDKIISKLAEIGVSIGAPLSDEDKLRQIRAGISGVYKINGIVCRVGDYNSFEPSDEECF